jgi:hypothetical protein
VEADLARVEPPDLDAADDSDTVVQEPLPTTPADVSLDEAETTAVSTSNWPDTVPLLVQLGLVSPDDEDLRAAASPSGSAAADPDADPAVDVEQTTVVRAVPTFDDRSVRLPTLREEPTAGGPARRARVFRLGRLRGWRFPRRAPTGASGSGAAGLAAAGSGAVGPGSVGSSGLVPSGPGSVSPGSPGLAASGLGSAEDAVTQVVGRPVAAGAPEAPVALGASPDGSDTGGYAPEVTLPGIAPSSPSEHPERQEFPNSPIEDGSTTAGPTGLPVAAATQDAAPTVAARRPRRAGMLDRASRSAGPGPGGRDGTGMVGLAAAIAFAVVLLIAAIPTAVLAWRAALWTDLGPSAVSGAIGGALALAGLALLGFGGVPLVRELGQARRTSAEPDFAPAAGPERSLASLLARPSVVLIAVGLVALLGAAIAIG